ncbi:MAG: tripartite tricarboxylate transporter substrate binding protein [Acidobacteriaceae bacterium]|nr:tripartite tricarboxylate transporter substrate binding protein [Acidobacteriaceae bacterium]
MPWAKRAAAFACLLAGTGMAGQAIAQAWPSKPVRFLVGFAPGGSVDLTARMLGGPTGEALGTQVIVENRPGASGNIAGEAAAKAAPDGYTLMISSGGPLAANRAVIADMSFDPQRDFSGIALAAFQANIVVVNPRVPAKNMSDLIRIAKSAPNKLSYGSAGVGSGAHINGEMFNLEVGINAPYIPYKGPLEAMNDVMSGRIGFTWLSLGVAAPFIRDGRVVALGVSTPKRSPMFPNLPTVGEGLPGHEFDQWFGLLGNAKAPRAVINQVSKEVARIVQLPDVRERLQNLGTDPKSSSPEEFDRFIRSQIERLGKVIKAAGIKSE